MALSPEPARTTCRPTLRCSFPTSRASPVPSSTDPALTRTRLFEGVVRLVRIAATERPLVILIDDAHSMGRATGALVRALLASCDDGRLAVVLAARDQHHRERSGLQDVLRHFVASRIRIDGLTEADLEAWLAWAARQGRLGPSGWEARPTSRFRTGGVPLLVQSALSEARTRRGVSRPSGSGSSAWSPSAGAG